jgi:hypothetical protein
MGCRKRIPVGFLRLSPEVFETGIIEKPDE